MKKLLLAIFSFYGLSVASAAYVGSTEYDTVDGVVTLNNPSSWATNGSFAVSFEFEETLFSLASSGMFQFSFILGDDTDNGFRVDLAGLSGMVMYTVSHGDGPHLLEYTPDVKGPFVIQFNSEDNTVCFAYLNEGNFLEVLATSTLNATYTLPTTINVSKMTYSMDNVATTPPVEEVVTWQGEVSAEEVANPSVVPTVPSVPEPATATLSLLALCGLAARRRR